MSNTAELINEATLKDVGLLYFWNGQWKYKFSLDHGWMTANSKQDAIDRASVAYAATPKKELLTRIERAEKAEKAEFDAMHKIYGGYTVAELQSLYAAQGGQMESLQLAATREFNGNGGRRTSAAVAADGARETAEFRMKLKMYMNARNY